MNLKILINFETKKVVHTREHAGSLNYAKLIKDGYVKVGTIKDPNEQITPFWDPKYFEPGAKYLTKTKTNAK